MTNLYSFPTPAGYAEFDGERNERVELLCALLTGNGYNSDDLLRFGPREWRILGRSCPPDELSEIEQAQLYARMREVETQKAEATE